MPIFCTDRVNTLWTGGKSITQETSIITQSGESKKHNMTYDGLCGSGVMVLYGLICSIIRNELP